MEALAASSSSAKREKISIYDDPSSLFIVGTKQALLQVKSCPQHRHIFVKPSSSARICLFPSINKAISCLPPTSRGPIYLCPLQFPESIHIVNRSIQFIGLPASIPVPQAPLKPDPTTAVAAPSSPLLPNLNNQSTHMYPTITGDFVSAQFYVIKLQGIPKTTISLQNIIIQGTSSPASSTASNTEQEDTQPITGLHISGPIILSLQNVDIFNCTFGIRAQNSSDIRLKDCHLSESTMEMMTLKSNVSMAVQDCIISKAHGSGIYAWDSVLNLSNSHIHDVIGNGILLRKYSTCVCNASSIRNNAYIGISVEDSSDCRIEKSSFDGNGLKNICFGEKTTGAAKHCTLKSSDFGVDINGAGSDVTAANLMCIDNRLSGCRVQIATRGLIPSKVALKAMECRETREGSGFLFVGGRKEAIHLQKIVISDCISTNNSKHGFGIVDCVSLKLDNCTAEANQKSGFYFRSLGEIFGVTRCSSSSNKENGYTIKNCRNFAMGRCTAENNGVNGFFVLYAPSSSKYYSTFNIGGSIASSNGRHGFLVEHVDKDRECWGLVQECTSQLNARSGFAAGELENGSAVVCRLQLLANKSIQNKENGFTVFPNASMNLRFASCSAEKNEDRFGFALLSPKCAYTVTQCSAIDCVESGFFFEALVTGSVTKCTAISCQRSGFQFMGRCTVTAAECVTRSCPLHGFYLHSLSAAFLDRCIAESIVDKGFYINGIPSSKLRIKNCVDSNDAFDFAPEPGLNASELIPSAAAKLPLEPAFPNPSDQARAHFRVISTDNRE